MRYYVIINGVNSLTIEGLAIKTLPPISKPAMRNIREEIDGRDGDITTELGYGAYDRILEIGLYGAYDIDKIISFFNSKGTIIFSDEPDKYYNFEIVDRIDYTKLVKFRTAMINIHCQPFKYPVTEEPQVEEYEYVEGTGEAITLNNTEEAILNKIELIGNTSQDGTPTPTNPIPIHVVSGDNTIEICGKNRFKPLQKGIGINSTNGSQITSGTNAATDYIPISFSNNEKYYLSGLTNTLNSFIASYNKDKVFLGRTNGTNVINWSLAGNVFTNGTPQGTGEIAYIRVTQYYISTNTGTIDDVDALTPQLESGNQATEYEPPTYAAYPINLGINNLLGIPSGTYSNHNITAVVEDGIITLNGTASGGTSYININLTDNISTNGEYYTYSISNTTTSTIEARLFDTNNNYIALGTTTINNKTTRNDTRTFNLLSIVTTNGVTLNNFIIKPQLEKGEKANKFTPYGTTPVEMASIPNTNYFDYFKKENDKWYKHRVIGKKTLDGTEPWNKLNLCFQTYQPFPTDGNIYGASISAKSSHFTYHYVASGITSALSNGEFGWNSSKYLTMRNDDCSVTNDFKTWLENNNPTIYYILTTPNDIEVNETLADQLEAIKNAISYSGQTNISQANNDEPFILDVSALKLGSDHLVINNSGNIYAKPTMDIEGTGVVDIYLNDVQILEADLTETNNIVIDTEAMEAYNPDTNALANRQVTGDYSKIKLEPGENDLRFSGALSKATITNYKRWL